MLDETIQSVLQQSFTNYEYWIIDGNSNDGTQDLVRSYGDRIYLISENDYGIYHAMNKGFSKSKGTWLYFLNAGDTFYNADVLSSFFDTTISDSTMMIYGDIRTKNHPSGSDYTQGKAVQISDFYYQVGLCHQAVFTHRKAFETIGNYEYMEYPILADQEWFVRFLKSGLQSSYVPKTIAFYEVVGESYLKRKQNYKDHLKIVASHFSKWVIFMNRIREPWMLIKIYLLQKLGGGVFYKIYRRLFFKD